jgi:S1-C subfamily serine protease
LDLILGAATDGSQDVVLEVNRTPVNGATEASREFQKVKSGEIATMLVLRQGQEVFVTMRKE